ncbi:integrase catalytic domain-containing protein [Trichonephila clavata]|uniref:Integrase catalytic domain-containing protein n=1 Tax=Trichonephila clavata TaxID=2740835 RepID=A0A8X6FWX4_TRICU|nr:integrase catalytic domain-containing protein [Trichonephila clavata]
MKLANALAEETPTDLAELQAKLDFIVKLQEKFELLKEEYYRVVPEEEFEDIEISLAEMDDEIQKIEVSVRKTRFTKRDVLSQITRIYDPLGLLGPVIAKAKIFIQQLWLLKLTRNKILPSELSQQWDAFIDTLQYLEAISVQICVLLTSVKSIIVQGFADASSRAYGAVVYIQAVSKTGETRSQLLCSKSRVAPLKMMTIPRLELAACLLLVKLTNKVLAALKERVDSVKLWTDSSIALS